jgi:hypothetical protein
MGFKNSYYLVSSKDSWNSFDGSFGNVGNLFESGGALPHHSLFVSFVMPQPWSPTQG